MLPPQELSIRHRRHYHYHHHHYSGNVNNNFVSSLHVFIDQDQDDYFLPESSFGSEAVPEGQRPVNEYIHLLQQPLFDWAAEEKGTKGLVTRLVMVYAVVFGTICYPIAGATFTQPGYMLEKLTASSVGAFSIVLLLLIRLYSGWGYVGSRLQSKYIEYEETGWFDGNLEPKSISEQKRDAFLYQAQVQPVVQRLQQVTLAVAALWLACCIGLHTVTVNHPRFDEYNPAMLERLRYDEKLADLAAQQSGGKPTYCDNRFYRAIANDGQGCN